MPEGPHQILSATYSLPHILCHVCGSKHLKKNIKWHMCTHETGVSSERIKCSFKGCLHTFSSKSNLNQHIKAGTLSSGHLLVVLLVVARTKHVRDNHEKTGAHVYTQGDFQESDKAFRSRPRGGRKRNSLTVVEMLQRKRVIPPNEGDSVLKQGSDYIAWLLSATDEYQQ